MTAREMILVACLVALGAVSFRDARERDHRRLAYMLQRERALLNDVRALAQRGHDLRREADALVSDRYYIERVARADLGWRPGPGRMPTPPSGPSPSSPPVLLVQDLPSVDAWLPLPVPAGPSPQPPASPAEALAAGAPPTREQWLALLGYASVDHFQRKMMKRQPSGVLDEPTLRRARRLVALVRHLGFESVKAFQQRNGLAPDGVLGRQTEQRAIQILRRTDPNRVSDFLADNGRRSGPGG